MPVLFKRSELRGLHFKDARIELVLAESGTHDDECGIRDGYLFDIYTLDSREHAGYVSLRIGESPALYYLATSATVCLKGTGAMAMLAGLCG